MAYLGHIINSQGIKADTSRATALDEWKPPKGIKSVQRLHGFFNWFRPFAKNLSLLIQPLTDLLQKSKTFRWTQLHNNCVEDVIKRIKEQTLLAYSDYSKPFRIETDASEKGMGAVLYQENQIIGLYSHKFSGSNLRYTIPEKELLAVIKALEYFKPYIYI